MNCAKPLLGLSILTVVILLSGVGRSAPPVTGSPKTRPAGPAAAKAGDTQPAYPLWDGNESVADYAKRAGIRDAQITLTLDGNVALKLTLIPAGKFLMGSPAGEKDRHDVEGPQHEVTISKPFYMGVYTVTQAQWKAIKGTSLTQQRDKVNRQLTPNGEGDDHPMYFVSWHEAVEFSKSISQKTGKAASLPTEAQWEYACRAGSITRFFHGDAQDKLGDYAWYSDNSGGKTHPVGLKKPNDWGLYDMHGNVSQWCADWASDSYIDAGKTTDPSGPASGSSRVERGGSWGGPPDNCRSAQRGWNMPSTRAGSIGFRVTVDLK